MRDKPKRRRAVPTRNLLPTEDAARMRRRVLLLLGSVPLPEMTQEETDWVFHQSQRVTDE